MLPESDYGLGDRLRDRMPVHLHLGAIDMTGRAAVLGARSIAPGEAGLVQVLLDREIGALHGDRFVLRDQSATRTIGGGVIIDPFPPVRGWRRPERRTLLDGIETSDHRAALAGLLETSPGGVDLAAFARARNLNSADAAALWRDADMARVSGEEAPIGLLPANWQAVLESIVEALKAWHAEQPESPGLDRVRLRGRLRTWLSARLADAAIEDLIRAKRVVRQGGSLRLPDHDTGLGGRDAVLWGKIEPLLAAGGTRPPRVRELAEALGMDHKPIEALLWRVAKQGQVVAVAENRFFPPAALVELAALAEQLAAESPDGQFSAAAYKDRSGVGRNVAIQLLEHFDKRGFTRRDGATRRVMRPAARVFGA
jgi:selenocysteine-specific elongation factor